MPDAKGWKIETWNADTEQRAGWMAGHVHYDNACKIRRHENYNGSGPSAFGGARKWPALTVDISFEVGQESLRDELAEKIKALIDEMLPE